MGTDEELFEQLNKLRGSKTIILGIGNTLKGDDGAGPAVCERIAGKICAEVIDAGTVPENYIQSIIKKAPQNLIIIDAVDFGSLPGTIKLFETERLSSLVISTHTLSPRIFIDMIRNQVKVSVFFIGVQPERTSLGEVLSANVTDAVERLAEALSRVFSSD
ncbi:MAG: hydrogenase 3 maturation endopeptidase HyCI [Planctomycetota bacterium]|jgi:hydrogenase 3 maturation protease